MIFGFVRVSFSSSERIFISSCIDDETAAQAETNAKANSSMFSVTFRFAFRRSRSSGHLSSPPDARSPRLLRKLNYLFSIFILIAFHYSHFPVPFRVRRAALLSLPATVRRSERLSPGPGNDREETR